MVWNVQGAGSREFLSVLRETVRTHKPIVLALVETHMGGVHALKIASSIGFNGHTRVDAQGFSGGIWLHRFNQWVEDNQLLEVEFSGPSHTWSRGKSPEIWKSARLDRTLCNTEWSLLYETARVKHLPALQSDHCPLLISSNGFSPLNEVNRPFRFQAAWLTHENFKDFIHTDWSHETPLIPLLHSLSENLKTWNKEIFHNIFRK